MQSKMLMTGVVIFGASVLLVLVLLATHGGANKSRQFEVLGDLLSGRHGSVMRALLVVAMGGLAVGAMISFSAVGRSDAARRKYCQETCVQRGFTQGTLGLSAGRDASGRSYKVCRCSGGPEKELELDPSTFPESE
jgi:hypothetical protein